MNFGIGPIVGIDASRNRSGGARAHLIGLLTALDPREHGIGSVHVWSYGDLLDAIPGRPWLVKHRPVDLEKSILHQMWWQKYKFPKELRQNRCDILLSTDAGSVCRFSPNIVMSRDMLSFEPGQMSKFGFSYSYLRLFLLRHMQINSLRAATATIFLTKYASGVIQQFTGKLPNFQIIPHGISPEFRKDLILKDWNSQTAEITCLYVSNVDIYKHQWNVVIALRKLRDMGYPVKLILVGGGSGPARTLLESVIATEDIGNEYVKILDAVKHERIPNFLSEADIFIFASSCENMPNTLLEAMACGLPIACSDRGPMPEVLQDAGLYFDPESPDSIMKAVEGMLTGGLLKRDLANKAKLLSKQYSWERCAHETWGFLGEVFHGQQ